MALPGGVIPVCSVCSVCSVWSGRYDVHGLGRRLDRHVLVRTVRDMANGAKTRMRDEMGPEFDDVEWQKLDPRQYDPRRIIRDALLDGTDAAPKPSAPSMATPPSSAFLTCAP